MIKKYYAIRKGHQSGVVVDSWEQCKVLTDGCKGAVFKGFASYQKEQADQFAKYGVKRNQTPKKKKATPRINETLNQRFNRLSPCIMRKTYTDEFTGELYKNRCVMRKGPTITGENYNPTGDNSIPW